MIRRADLRFAYRLATIHGRLDVDAMLAEMTASDLSRWEAYLLLEPQGSDVDDHRAGQIAATIANGLMRRKGGGEFRPSDFFPSRIPRPEPERTPESEALAVFGPSVVFQGEE